MTWEVIKWKARNGFEQLHLDPPPLADEGLQRFSLGQGTEEHQVEYVRYDFRQGDLVTAKDAASGWFNRVFHILPSVVSRLAEGTLQARGITLRLSVNDQSHIPDGCSKRSGKS